MVQNDVDEGRPCWLSEQGDESLKRKKDGTSVLSVALCMLGYDVGFVTRNVRRWYRIHTHTHTHQFMHTCPESLSEFTSIVHDGTDDAR